ncbi:MAG: 1-(5-phosphoribosyl)-5-[(5-phosphoribosylamino)methylideneamino]imidazole-4-carboxamide isomerase [Candidatus Heimdallarchaeota archaeon]|nr:1-(5-phosphoribosyl)-5-[(5-phosphoribosylamino)methylideneamino]imidazole-4-carboxamide isomerase [Candidatus Heimdallarchaeota archaeon]
MEIIPAIDLMNGKSVRLVKGNPDKAKVYYDDPLQAAELFLNEGAKRIHIIDLDAALGRGENLDQIARIIRNLPINVQVGGGIRSLTKTQELIDYGVERVIYGTLAVKNPQLVKHVVEICGRKKVAVAVDENMGKAAIRGWQQNSQYDYLEFVKMQEVVGVGTIIFTTTNVDGTMAGPQITKISRLVQTTSIPIIASGGVGSLEDIRSLKAIGVEGVIIGTALYEQKFSVKEALKVANNAS